MFIWSDFTYIQTLIRRHPLSATHCSHRAIMPSKCHYSDQRGNLPARRMNWFCRAVVEWFLDPCERAATCNSWKSSSVDLKTHFFHCVPSNVGQTGRRLLSFEAERRQEYQVRTSGVRRLAGHEMFATLRIPVFGGEVTFRSLIAGSWDSSIQLRCVTLGSLDC
jgi:hypothetical protein